MAFHFEKSSPSKSSPVNKLTNYSSNQKTSSVNACITHKVVEGLCLANTVTEQP